MPLFPSCRFLLGVALALTITPMYTAQAQLQSNNAPAPSFLSSPFMPGISSETRWITTDINQDGKPDLVGVNGFGAVHELINPGNGTFNSFTPQLIAQGSSIDDFGQTISAADLNGDGYPDLVVVRPTNIESINVLLNQKNGSFTSTTTDVRFGNDAYFIQSSLIGDVTGDGKADIVLIGKDTLTAGNTMIALLIFPGKGDGTFGTPLAMQTFSFAGNFNQADPGIAATLADMNHDGKLDIVAEFSGQKSSGANGYVFTTVFANSGNGVFSNFPSGFPANAMTTATPVSVTAPYVADFDQDGNPDVLMPIAGNDANSGIYYAIGTGSTALPAFQKGLSATAETYNFADLNGDGHIDAAIGYNEGIATIYTVSAFSPTFKISISGPYVSGSVTDQNITEPAVPAMPADFNGDGYVDIPMPDYGGSSIGFIPGSQQGFQQAAPVIAAAPTSGNPTTHLAAQAAGDLDGDGKTDLLALDYDNITATGNPNVVSYLNQGNKKFGYVTAVDPTLFAKIQYAYIAPFLVDFDGDHRADAIVATNDRDRLWYLKSHRQTPGVFDSYGPIPIHIGKVLAHAIDWITYGDVNGDGKPDLVLAYSGDSSDPTQPGKVPSGIFVLINDGTGGFTPSFIPYGKYLAQVCIADFNGDGKADLAVLDGYYNNFPNVQIDSSVSILPGNGDGTFNVSGAHVLPYISEALSTIIPGDFNRDGKQDLFVGVSFSDDRDEDNGGYITLQGNGDFTFKYSSLIGNNQFIIDDAQYADLNGDGLPDMVVGLNDAWAATTAFGYFENLGGGNFGPLVQFFSPQDNAGFPQHVMIGDFNMDGAPDAAVLFSPSNVTGIFYNNTPK